MTSTAASSELETKSEEIQSTGNVMWRMLYLPSLNYSEFIRSHF